MHLVYLLLTIVFVFACKYQEVTLPKPIDLREFQEKYENFEKRLISKYTENGFVVLRKNEIIKNGDSLLWTGLAMGLLPCEKAYPIFKSVMLSIKENKGAIVRFFPLPSAYQNDQASRDMLVGLMFGLISLHKRCPSQRREIADTWRMHVDYIVKNGFKLNKFAQASKSIVNPSLKYVIDMVSKSLGVSTILHAGQKMADGKITDSILHIAHLITGIASNEKLSVNFPEAAFKSALIANVETILLAKLPCYPIHLSTLQLIILHFAEEPISFETYKIFCERTKNLDLFLTDWYCQRKNENDVKTYLKNYQTNQFEYEHQRCKAFEHENSSHLKTPALDWIIIYQLANKVFRANI